MGGGHGGSGRIGRVRAEWAMAVVVAGCGLGSRCLGGMADLGGVAPDGWGVGRQCLEGWRSGKALLGSVAGWEAVLGRSGGVQMRRLG